MSFTVVIPSRFASTRLPGKPLLDIDGLPMIEHVYRRAKASSASRVVIATDDARIYDVATAFGAEVCMTSADHESGTDRLQEVALSLELDDAHIVVNVQGDEPLIPPAVIDQVAVQLQQSADSAIATLVEPIDDAATVFDPNAVKVVLDNSGRAMYFSRAPMPWARDQWSKSGGERQLPASSPYYRHIGIYAYRSGFLHSFVQWPASTLEQLEKLEQLRALENGVAIQAAIACESIPAGVDTEADLHAVRQYFKSA